MLAADTAVIHATATGAPGRIDDETEGIPLASPTTGATAGTLVRPWPATSARPDFTRVDAFYHQLCPDCAASNRARRDARTDLAGRRALLTGGRAKIGMYIALRLLRDGADTTITTRFPNDAVRRFAAMADSADWLHRLHIVGIDLRDPAQVVALADSMAENGSLDILINNAAQTVRRSPGSYALLEQGESAALPPGPLPDVLTFGRAGDAHPAALVRRAAGRGVRAVRRRRDSARPHRPLGHRRADGSGERRRRRRSRTRHRVGQQLDPGRRRGRPAGAARGAAVQLDGAVHPDQPAARRPRGITCPPQVHRQRVGHGRPVLEALQGPWASAHEHGQGRAQHADPHQRRRAARRRHPR